MFRIGVIVFLLSGIPRLVFAQPSSLFMDAAVEWVNVGDLDVAGDQLTVEALIHYTGVSVNIVSKHTDPSNVNYLLRIGSFEITTTAGFANFGGVAAAGVTLSPGTTYHVAATYNGQFLRYYVNGCLTGEMPWTGTMAQNNLATAIGQQSACQCEQFLGYIDEVRIWNVARTQAQIRDNMLDLPTPTLQPGLLAYYKFDGNSVNLQGNAAFNGTVQGAATFQQIPYLYPSSLNQTVSSSNPVCDGDANGTINVQASGAYTPYQYSIDGLNFQASPNFTNLPAGNYTVVSRPQNNANCITTSAVQITDPLPIASNLQTTQITCFGANNGSASVNPSGGDGPLYRVQWSTGQTGNSISNLGPGNYSVAITDSCARSGPELVQNGAFQNGTSGFTSDYTSCNNCYNGFNDIPGGAFVVSHNSNLHHSGFNGLGNGGQGNFMIVNGSDVPNTNVWCQTINVQPDTYYFFSTAVSSVVAASPAQLQFEVNGALLGPVFTAPAATGVWSTFSSVWFSGPSTTAVICILNQNTTLGGNDFGLDDISFKACISCTESFPFTITEPSQLQVNVSGTDVSCNGGNDGTAQAVPSGGTGLISYSWSTNPIQNTNTINGLIQGNYSVTVSDANLCTATGTVVIGFVSDPQITAIVDTDIDCSTPNGGSITVTATGNNLQYSIDGGLTFQVSNSFTGLNSGNYAIVVQENGCQQTGNTTISASGLLSITTNQTDISCPGIADGSATVNILSGNGNYTFNWNTVPVQNTQTINGLNQGTYTVTVIDGNGCNASSNVNIGVQANPQITAIATTDIQCFNGSNGSITVTAGGTGLQYSIDGGLTFQTSNQFNGLAAGVYPVLIQQNTCQDNGFATINEPDQLELDIATTNTTCNGQCNGVVVATVTGGVLDYNYGWSNNLAGAADVQASSVCAGNYSITITDANGCTVNQQFSITEPPALEIENAFISNETCLNDCDGSIDLTAQNAVSFQLGTNPQQPGGSFGDLCPGTYSVTLSDIEGCTLNQDFTILPGTTVQASFNADRFIVSELEPFVNFSNTSTGAVTYEWDFAAVGTSALPSPGFRFTGFLPGIYPVCLEVTNQQGCRDSVCRNITVREDLLVYVPNTFTPNFDGNNDVFRPVCLACIHSDYSFRIYNRWGEIVFQTEDPTAGWDGTLGGGIRAQSGTYVWHMQLMLDGDVVVHTMRGHVNLLR